MASNQEDSPLNGMDEETSKTCSNLSFEEFLRQRQDESMQGKAQEQPGTSGRLMTMTGNVEVDESPLRPSINRNKESLKLKLQMRRPINQLVEQGILPSPNTPPAFACQRVKLERARMGDLLKAKIQQRPSRSELVRQHILEETDPRVAPLLAEKQRMLKRARLADSLNDHLIHRPGPLELVQKNILHAPDESIEKAIKEGIVPFKATCEGATPGPSLPTKYQVSQEDDSSSSDVSSPSVASEIQESAAPPPSVPPDIIPESVVEVQVKAPVVVVPVPPPLPITLPQQTFQFIEQQTPKVFALPLYPPSSTITQQHQQQPVFQISSSNSSNISGGGGKCRSKKIQKSKSQSKPKTIKFHEYKGPPNAPKPTAADKSKAAESSYELLLQQQQLFLQWQLEWQHRFPKILLPAVSKMSAEEKKAFCSTLVNSPPTFTPPPVPPKTHHQQQHPIQLPNSVLILSTTTTTNENVPNTQTLTYVPQLITKPVIEEAKPKLNDWKVNELKAELKKRGLPVSGSKSQLVERLQGSMAKDVKEIVEDSPGEVKFFIPQEFLQKNLELNNSRTVLQQKIHQKLQNNAEQNRKESINEGGNSESWVLKIRETAKPTTVVESSSPSSSSFDNCLASLMDNNKESSNCATTVEPQPPSSIASSSHVKSQMVDDVLEILIRNGELPPSAATNPNLTIKDSSKPPPSPPPLPPSTFSITLPTEITFRKQEPILEQIPQSNRKGSLLGITLLTKEAQDILKISENLKQEEAKKDSSSSSVVIDELLTSTLEFPMDTEYSDWLESFSTQDNTFNNFNNIISHRPDDSRDPLLSSKSSRLILDNDQMGDNNGEGMEIDGTDTQHELNKIVMRNEDHVNLNGDFWDLSF